MPRCGWTVVNAYGATLGRARVIARNNVLLPAFGRPIWNDENNLLLSKAEFCDGLLHSLTNPRWAILLSSTIYDSSSPYAPYSHTFGACCSLVVKKWLPLPPAPPRAATNIIPSLSKSPTTFPFAFRMTVPIGTLTIKCSADLPLRSVPEPFSPLVAFKIDVICDKLLQAVDACKTTCPPFPPSPPSGPAYSFAHKLKNDIAPSPPLPPTARICFKSTNCWY